MLFMGLTEYANKAYELEQSTVHVLQNSAIAAVIKVVSSVILLKALGFTGGALGSVVAFASYFIITCVRVRSRFLFRVAPISLVRIIVSALLCGAGGLCVHAAAGRQSHSPWRGCRGRCRRLCGVHYRQR